MTKVIGVTGSIGMGKSATACRLAKILKSPLFDADKIAHHLTGPDGKALAQIARIFPQAMAGGQLDRQKLGGLVFSDPKAKRKLEAVLHPLINRQRQVAIQQARRQNRRAIILDIPLLFEKKIHRQCDLSILVEAPLSVQKRRVLSRPGMTARRFRHILSNQMPLAHKQRIATFCMTTATGYGPVMRSLKALVCRVYVTRTV